MKSPKKKLDTFWWHWGFPITVLAGWLLLTLVGTMGVLALRWAVR